MVVLRSPALFVGRTEELARIAAAAAHVRLFAVTGIGGIGKTSLMLRAAEDIAERTGARLAYHACVCGDSVASVLRGLGGIEPPAVLVVDDVQRCADPALLAALIGYALRRVELWVFVGSREALAIDPAAVDHVALRLGALSELESAELWSQLEALYGATAHDAIAGSPLSIKQAFGGGTVDLGLAELPAPALELARRLCAFRRPVAASTVEPASLALLERRLLIEHRGDGTIALHDMVREAVERSPQRPTAADHAYCLAASRDELEMLHHAVACGSDDRALEILAPFAEYCRGVFPPDARVEHELAVAIEALARRRELPVALQLLLLRIRWRQGRFEQAYLDVRAIQGGGALADLDLGEAAFTVGRLDEAIAALGRVVTSELGPVARCWAAVIYAEALHQSGRYAEARRVLAPDAPWFRDAGPLGALAFEWATAVRAHDCEDLPAASAALAKLSIARSAIPLISSIERAIAAARGEPEPAHAGDGELYDDTLYLRMAARLMRAVELTYRGQLRAALELADATLALTAQDGCRLIEWWGLWIATDARRMLGCTGESLAPAQLGLRACEAMGYARLSVRIRLAIANALVAQGEFAQAVRIAEPALARIAQMPGTRAQLHAVLAIAEAATGSAELAARRLGTGARLPPYERAEWQLVRCEVQLWGGRLDEARVQLAAVDATWDLLACRRDLALAELALRSGALGSAAALAAKVAAAANREPFAVELVRAQMIAAAAARCAGDTADAMLRRAREDARRFGLATELGAIDTALGGSDATRTTAALRLARRLALADPLVIRCSRGDAAFALTEAQARMLDTTEHPTVFDLAFGRVKLGHRQIELAKHATLLRVLEVLVHAGGVISLDQLASQAWGVEYHPLRHRGRTAMAIHRLRRMVGARVIEASAAGYRIVADAPWLVIERIAAPAAAIAR